MISLTTVDGAEYTLEYDGLYRWTTKGKVAKCLSNPYSSHHVAVTAFKMYNAGLHTAPNLKASEKALEELTSKSDLLGWAEANSIEVPAKYKQPSAIKKFLQGGYDAKSTGQ